MYQQFVHINIFFSFIKARAHCVCINVNLSGIAIVYTTTCMSIATRVVAADSVNLASHIYYFQIEFPERPIFRNPTRRLIRGTLLLESVDNMGLLDNGETNFLA